jgi:ferrochelatase
MPASPSRETGILLMGYGSPAGPEDLPGYLAEVLGGRAPSPAMVEEYRRRYEQIGWSPQMRILHSLRKKLESRLETEGNPSPVFLATKHWTPHIEEVIPEAAREGIRRLIAVPLSPYASTWIMTPYERAIENGRRAAESPVAVEIRAGWHTNPSWIRYWVGAIHDARSNFPAQGVVLLSAHSLPERMRRSGDPYPALLAETVERIVRGGDLGAWDFTYQSAGNTTEPWLGPDITEKMIEWRDRGAREQIVAPIGFLFDHLEVLYDLDVVIRRFAEAHEVRYHRIPMPNDDDRIVEALRAVVAP